MEDNKIMVDLLLLKGLVTLYNHKLKDVKILYFFELIAINQNKPRFLFQTNNRQLQPTSQSFIVKAQLQRFYQFLLTKPLMSALKLCQTYLVLVQIQLWTALFQIAINLTTVSALLKLYLESLPCWLTSKLQFLSKKFLEHSSVQTLTVL